MLKISVFFDGTGNNRKVDIPDGKQSNIAKLWALHPENNVALGEHSVYVAGIGTYSVEVQDPDFPFSTEEGVIASIAQAFGRRGMNRLDYAMEEMEKRAVASPRTHIQLALFGFSRGAALARAFARRIQDRTIVLPDGRPGIMIADKAYGIAITFMGLFDTVASVGDPISLNDLFATSQATIDVALAMKDRQTIGTGIGDLAFTDGKQSSPASGGAHGHGSNPVPLHPAVTLALGPLAHAQLLAAGALFAELEPWAKDMRIPPIVERTLHFVAGHEIRNSFPLESITAGGVMPPGGVEVVLPGAHADVGGGYRYGEIGRAPALPLAVWALREMRQRALEAGVPFFRTPTAQMKALLGESPSDWKALQDLDRAVKRYGQAAAPRSRPLLQTIRAHMRQYLLWRLRRARTNRWLRARGKPTPDEAVLRRMQPEWQRLKAKLEADRAALQSSVRGPQHRDYDERLAILQARIRGVPVNVEATIRSLRAYDEQLIADAETLAKLVRESSGQRTLRPHYQNLYDAWLASDKGPTPAQAELDAFFDTWVHDSLAGFALDATLPSDPRVVYRGGDKRGV